MMNEAEIERLWKRFRQGRGDQYLTEAEFRRQTGFTRETYMLPRQSGYKQGQITNALDPVWDLIEDRRVRFFGASADGWYILIVGNDGETFEGVRRPFQLHAY